ncbi:hypothetical protein CLOSTASPAR_02167 [[Clostridium] asparagiforme DSM 15981]|uniref:Uncharacterized protein n=1 Tax=[Clostridium] asparagiforme DSM 15981 TaxID=518636 RepID=C0CYU1_9FIRM|nr:hypothetical protein CLOSTASPAR_02167 [[Clostridium] asparagiforme DSM 15981]
MTDTPLWILVDKNSYVSSLYFVISRQADDQHYVSSLYFVTSRQADDQRYVSLIILCHQPPG